METSAYFCPVHDVLGHAADGDLSDEYRASLMMRLMREPYGFDACAGDEGTEEAA